MSGRVSLPALVALLALAPLLAAGAAAQVQLEQRVFEIARGLRCPACVSESVADSAAPIAVEMREIIQEQLVAGRSEGEIVDYFVARYGDWILLDPPKRGLHLLVWLLPLAAAVVGAAALAFYLRRWTLASRAPIDVDEAELARVRRLLADEEPAGETPARNPATGPRGG